jgi:chemotaxis signal transduction protein
VTPTVGPSSEEERVRELLERRATRLRERPRDADEEESFWIAELTLGDAVYALPLADLLGVVPVRLVVPVPLAAPHVLGVVRFRGEMVTALSLAWLLGAPGWRRDPSVLVVVALGDRKLAIDCEEVPKPVALPASAWTSREMELAKPGGPATIDLTTGDLRTVRIIRLDRLLAGHAETGTGGT